jgi:hypothetical protein
MDDISLGGQPPKEPQTWERIRETARTAPTPVDNTAPPRAPDFAPPLMPLGQRGWRDSEGPTFCHSLRFAEFPLLWADEEGIAVATLGHCEGALDSPTFACASRPAEEQDTGTDIRYNDGSGWRWVYGHPVAVLGLSGFAGTQTFILTAGEAGVATLDLEGKLFPLFAGKPKHYYTAPTGLASGRVLVTVSDNESQSLLEVGESNASTIYDSSGRWGGRYAWHSDTIYIYDDYSFYVASSGGAFEVIPDSPVGGWEALAADASGGLWAASTEQLVYFDGSAWTVIGDLPGESVHGIATVGDDLYLAASSHFLKATRTEVTSIVYDLGLIFTAVAASPSGDVFVAARDMATANDQCSGDFVAYWDGAEFHLF